jgi:uncharacterized protein YndB with AHSA1/START domain
VSAREFVYAVFIAASPEKVWEALTLPRFTHLYWFGRYVDSDWRIGASVSFWVDEAHTELDFAGKVLKFEPPRLLSFSYGVKWGPWVQRSASHRGLLRERPSRVSFELEPADELTRLTLVHDAFPPGGTALASISRGWPEILSGLKRVMESDPPAAAQLPQP